MVWNLARRPAPVSYTHLDVYKRQVYDVLRNGRSDQKAEFALDLIYAVDPSELSVPAYIDEGLGWLQDYLTPEE